MRSQKTNLGNWRLPPFSQWGFQHVRELIPTANISSARSSPHDSIHLSERCDDVPNIFGIADIGERLMQDHTDSMMVLHNGKALWNWNAPHYNPANPHILFSVSKSVTGLLMGVLCEESGLDLNRNIAFYLPDCEASAYGDATVQQVLDMQVSLDFEEDYLNPSGDYFNYRNATGWNPVDQTHESGSLESFICGLGKGIHEHGLRFEYKSPNSDLLGLLIDRLSDSTYSEYLSSTIWQPMGAGADGYVTVDAHMLARGAGGICVTTSDLARVGQMVLDKGSANGNQVIPEHWIDDIWSGGNPEAWQQGGYLDLLPSGCYRNQWYQVRDTDHCLIAIGIHGQWLYINPARSVVIAKFSSQPDPVEESLDLRVLALFDRIARTLGDSRVQ